MFWVLGRVRVGGLGLCSELATAAARWRPRSSAGARGTGRRGTARGGCGPRGEGVTRGAAVKLEVACGHPRVAGGAAQQRRQRKNREANRRWKKGDFL